MLDRVKPLFVPLKTAFFREFEAGSKRIEYRRYGPRWNERVCTPGRPVTLSHGYSGARIAARVVSFSAVQARDAPDGQGTYGPDALIAMIELEIHYPEVMESPLPAGHFI
jgi:hypothetical protein